MNSALRALLLLAVLATAAAVPAHACAACANPDVKSPMIDGAKIGMGILLGVTILVQGGFVAFFLHLRRLAKRHQEMEIDSEWSVLQRSSSPS